MGRRTHRRFGLPFRSVFSQMIRAKRPRAEFGVGLNERL